MTTFTPDELARTLFTNDGVCSQYDWDVARRNPALALTAAALKAKDADNADG